MVIYDSRVITISMYYAFRVLDYDHRPFYKIDQRVDCLETKGIIIQCNTFGLLQTNLNKQKDHLYLIWRENNILQCLQSGMSRVHLSSTSNFLQETVL